MSRSVTLSAANRVLDPEAMIDGYKLGHREQYPEGTTVVYSNWTPRRSRVEHVNRIVLFGLQYFIHRFLVEEWNEAFFARPVEEVVDRYTRLVSGYLGAESEKVDVSHLRELHALGYLPLTIRAIPEGMALPVGMPSVVIENTHPRFFWLTNYIETLMSSVLWQPCTTATTARRMRQILDAHAIATGADPGFVDWQGHDFSFRGMPGPDAAAVSGAAHLIYFKGTDTVPSLQFIRKYYPEAAGVTEFLGGSVNATEHSVMSAGGSGVGDELLTFDRLLDRYRTGIVSVVSDTWDLWRVVSEILPQLREKIMGREGKLVIRPDSGDPADILCGNPDGRNPYARRGLIGCLWDLFGGTVNGQGFRVLDPHIGAIYGDSINLDRANEILSRLALLGFASSNVVLGIGSYTYQYVTRDTYGFAMKATYARIAGKDCNLFKKPATDDGTKDSARGRLAVVLDKESPDRGWKLIQEATPMEELESRLTPVWQNGHWIYRFSFSKVRRNAKILDAVGRVSS